MGFSLYCTVQENGEGEDEGVVWIERNDNEVDATDFFVSLSGNDDASGTSEKEAFRTVTQAVRAVHPGGTIRILPGTYREAVAVMGLGHADRLVTIMGQDSGVVLDGGQVMVFALFFEDCKNIVVNDLEIRNYTDFGIGATLSNGITLTGLLVTENGHGVQLTDWGLEGYGIHVDESEKVVIEENETYRNGPEPQVIPQRIMGTGINTYGNRQVLIRNNRSHHNIGGGILVEDSYDVIVEGNEVYENDLDATVDEWWDGGLWLDGGGRVTVRNNVFRDNLGPGIEISDEDFQNPTGYVLENNISTNNYYGIYIWNFGTNGWPPESVIRRSGNQFTGNSRMDVWIQDWASAAVPARNRIPSRFYGNSASMRF